MMRPDEYLRLFNFKIFVILDIEICVGSHVLDIHTDYIHQR